MEGTDERIDDLLRYLVDLVDKCPQSFRTQIDILLQLCLKVSFFFMNKNNL